MKIFTSQNLTKVFNAAQPGVGRVQVLGSKKFQTAAEELFFGIDIQIDKEEVRGGPSGPQTRGFPDQSRLGVPRPWVPRPGV